MSPRPTERDARPVARLRLVKAVVPRERAPVFHFFEELYARAAARAETAGERAPVAER